MMKKLIARLLCLSALLAFGLILLCFLASGCAHSDAGLKRESQIHGVLKAATDFLAHDVAPLIPQPYGSAATVALGAVGAALGAWHLTQEKRLAALKQTPSTGPPV